MCFSVSFLLFWVFATGNIDGSIFCRLSIRCGLIFSWSKYSSAGLWSCIIAVMNANAKSPKRQKKVRKDSDYDESANDLSCRMRHLLKTSEKFWKCWKKEFLLELWEFHRTHQISKGVKDMVQEGQTATIYDDGQPRGLWRVGRIKGAIQGPDGKIRSAWLRVQSKTGRATVLKHPIQHLEILKLVVRRTTQLIHSLRSLLRMSRIVKLHLTLSPRTTILKHLWRLPEDDLVIQLLVKQETGYSGG